MSAVQSLSVSMLMILARTANNLKPSRRPTVFTITTIPSAPHRNLATPSKAASRQLHPSKATLPARSFSAIELSHPNLLSRLYVSMSTAMAPAASEAAYTPSLGA